MTFISGRNISGQRGLLLLEELGLHSEFGPPKMGMHQTTGIIFEVARYSTNDGPGIRTTVFFKGCPLHCVWCHNPEGQSPAPQLVFRPDRCIHCLSCMRVCPHHAIVLIDGNPIVLGDRCEFSGECVRICQSGAREIAGKEITVGDLMQEIEKDTIFYDESRGGITFSGGEPFMQPVFLQTLLGLCKERRIHTAVETCGFVDSATLLGTSPYVDLYLYDLKVIDDGKHQSLTGVSNKTILENLRKLSRSHGHITVRFPVIPGVNDSDQDISQFGEFVSSIEKVDGVDILPYHKLGMEKYKRLGGRYRMAEIQPPTSEEMTGIAETLKGFGLSVRIGG